MNAYPKRVFCLLQEFAYLLHCLRNKGAVEVFRTFDLDNFEPPVRGIIRLGLEGITSGVDREQLRMLLEIRKLGLLKDPSVTAEDLKLVQICIESLYFMDVPKLEEFGTFAKTILDIEGHPEDRDVFSQLIYVFTKAEENRNWINREKLKEHISEIKKNLSKTYQSKEYLSKEEIDKLLQPHLSLGLKVGDIITFERTFTKEDVELFTKVSKDEGDHNIHPDEQGRLVIQGLLTATLPTKVGGEHNVLARTMNFEFIRPVFTGDTILCEVTIEEYELQENDRTSIFATFSSTNQNEKQVLKGNFAGVIL